MSKIAFEDIQVGDTVKVIDTTEIKVDKIAGDWINDYFGKGFNKQWQREFHLVDRPLPALPTEIGSVIEVAGERWFFQEQSGTTPQRWIDGYGSFLWPESMAQHVQEKGGFEVLL